MRNYNNNKTSFGKKVLYTGIALAVIACGAKVFQKPLAERFAFEKYLTSPIKDYTVQKGDNLTKYFNSENTSGKLNFEAYENAVLEMNDFYISGIERNLENPDKIVAGRTLTLPDINKDGYVGAKN